MGVDARTLPALGRALHRLGLGDQGRGVFGTPLAGQRRRQVCVGHPAPPTLDEVGVDDGLFELAGFRVSADDRLLSLGHVLGIRLDRGGEFEGVFEGVPFRGPLYGRESP